MERVILHSDLNNFYAARSAWTTPLCGGKPVAVCGDPALRHGIVLAKSGEAKSFGVATGRGHLGARLRCPGLVVVPPRYGRYLELSRQVRELYLQYTDQVEPFGWTRAGWMWGAAPPVRGREADCGYPADTDQERDRPDRVGGGVLQQGLRQAGQRLQKAGCHHGDHPGELPAGGVALPVGDLLYVGPATAKKLGRYGIRTIGALARARPRLPPHRTGQGGGDAVALCQRPGLLRGVRLLRRAAGEVGGQQHHRPPGSGQRRRREDHPLCPV